METDVVDSNKEQKRNTLHCDTDSKKRKTDVENISNKEIYSLPNDVLVEILKLVPLAQWCSLERVSRRFRIVVLEAWHCLKKIRLNEDLLIAAEDRFVDYYGERLTKHRTETVNSILEKLSLRAPNITHLDGFLVSNFTDLRRFALPPIYYLRGITLNNDSIRWLSRFDHLRSVDFSNCRMRLKSLAKFLRTSSSRGQLRELIVDDQLSRSMYGNVVLDDEEQEHCDEIMRSLLSNENPSLTPLKLEKFGFNGRKAKTSGFLRSMDVSLLTTLHVGNTRICSIDLISVIERAVNLTNLDFSFTTHSENVGEHLLQNKRLLTTIATMDNLSSLKICARVDDDFCASCEIHPDLAKMIVTLGRRRRLEEFSLSDRRLASREVVSAIADNMLYLKSLELSLIDDFPSDSLVRLIKNLKRLEKLSIKCHPNLQPTGVNDSVVSAIATNLTELRFLRLDRYFGREAATLNELAALTKLKDLRVILSYAPLTISSTMKIWSGGFGSTLESLSLSAANFLDIDDGLVALVENSPRLRRINLSFAKITNRSLRAIADSCRNLRELHLSTICRDDATPECFQKIIDGCSKLKRVTGQLCLEAKKIKYRKVNFELNKDYLEVD